MEIFAFFIEYSYEILIFERICVIIADEVRAMSSICRFMPAKNYSGSIKTINFVYESEFKKLRQPFFKTTFFLHMVVRGNARLRVYDNEYELRSGSLFFIFPGYQYTIDGSDDFAYIYISFMGSCVTDMLSELEIDMDRPVYPDFEHLIDFWRQSIRRINQLNANILTESVLLYTLSYINNKQEDVSIKKKTKNLFDTIVDYIEVHYREPDISLKQIAGIFSYTEKYLSYIFKKNMNIGFSSYLNNLRIQYAVDLINQGKMSVTEIAMQCGFSDSLYFSKVFRKIMGRTPTNYIKLHVASSVDAYRKHEG